jgi:hypothetical protein
MRNCDWRQPIPECNLMVRAGAFEPMSIVLSPGVFRWRVALPAQRDRVYELLTTDAGRELFWAELSRRDGTRIDLSFPDGTIGSMTIGRERPPRSFAVQYFGALTTFELSALDDRCTLLEVGAHGVPSADLIDAAAGWVSVLLCLKAYLKGGIDLRNHLPTRSWREGFVDN